VTRRARLVLSGAITVAVTGLLTAGAVHLADSRAAGLPDVGQVIPAAQRPPGPDISGATLTGGHLDTARWRGHAVVINFWGSWCVPCRDEAPALARVAADTRFLAVRFAGIDVREDPYAGLAFERDFRIPYPGISDPGRPDRGQVRGGSAAGHPGHLHPRRPRPDRLGLVRRHDLQPARPGGHRGGRSVTDAALTGNPAPRCRAWITRLS
jgi:thiol-disulfide isomerase/thioredoxin